MKRAGLSNPDAGEYGGTCVTNEGNVYVEQVRSSARTVYRRSGASWVGTSTTPNERLVCRSGRAIDLTTTLSSGKTWKTWNVDGGSTLNTERFVIRDISFDRDGVVYLSLPSCGVVRR